MEGLGLECQIFPDDAVQCFRRQVDLGVDASFHEISQVLGQLGKGDVGMDIICHCRCALYGAV